MTKKASSLPRGQRIMNTIFMRMVRVGLIPGAHLISVPGRKSGVMRTTPVFVLRHEGHRWLVAGFEQADWVKNLRAAGWCVLIHDRRQERVAVIEVEEPEVRAPLLRAFVRRAPGGNRGFTIKADASLSAFMAIAPQHPVFRVVEPTNAAAESQ
ncbi:MAG TPA: deazaflavin-dependent nitroreductase [Ktedonobacter sp.]|jgi:deazaflavin-dependent oxidoreductase (nitroreductase family)|nr:deazaflavin-dependent nitroreductase [Ktedonobacter sp.]HCF86734.1 deazaflavin-dependent nitroreductase [Ktedonobacter sp.]